MGLHVLFAPIWRSRSRLIALRNRTYIYTQFDAQNARNSFSELPDFKSFLGEGACPQTSLAKGAFWPLVNTVAYSSQTGCLLQTLLKPLGMGMKFKATCDSKLVCIKTCMSLYAPTSCIMTHQWRGVTRDGDNKAHTPTIHMYPLLPLYQKIEKMKIKKCGNCRSRNLTYKFYTCMLKMFLEC